MKILITGANGFIGRNLIVALEHATGRPTLARFDVESPPETLESGLAEADLIFHLAGVNRPKDITDFQSGNADFTAALCHRLLRLGRAVPIIFTSSIQAALANPYGESKRRAEETLVHYEQQIGAAVIIYRLKNVFGKWSRPNYNSVVATFCHNVAHDSPVTISDPARELELVHIDDVVRDFLSRLASPLSGGVHWPQIDPVYTVTLGRLFELLCAFRQMRQTLHAPNFADDFTRKLYGMFLSYLEPDDFSYRLDQKCDARGCLAEFMKSAEFGHLFVSRTHPGITRGNHFHHTKAEKFLVLEGEAVIRFRHIQSGAVLEYRVRGEDFRVVDIPAGYTHSIENLGTSELVTLFWANEIFDPARPDTYALPVLNPQSSA